MLRKLNFFAILLFLCVVTIRHGIAIHHPAYTGIKTSSYQRDPLIAEALEKQQQQQQHPYGGSGAADYHGNIDAYDERLSYAGNGRNYNNNNNNNARTQDQQQVQPIYERHGYGGSTPSSWNDAENAITEYYTGCPPQHTGPLPYAYDCRRFLNCFKGRGHIQSCGPGTVFNPETLECDRPDKVLCGATSALSGHISASGGAQRAERLLDAEPRCPVGATGLQPHPTDCLKFLNCANGNTYVQDCPPGTAYSVTMMGCDYKDKVDCADRTHGVGTITPVYDNANRGSKSYIPAGGAHLNQGGYDRSPTNSWQPHQHNPYSHEMPITSTSTQATTYRDRWSNMNMNRPTGASYNPYGSLPQGSEPVPTWSGHGTSIDRLAPTQNVLYVEGSLQPNRNYPNSNKFYSTPLAPFAPMPTTPSTQIYYAQPVVDSTEDKRELYAQPQNTQGRRNNSREIDYAGAANGWQPIPSSKHSYNPTRNDTNRTPFSQRPQTFPQTINPPNTQLMPPPPPSNDRGQQPITESDDFHPNVTTINIDDLPAGGHFHLAGNDQYPSESQPDASNLYGGLKPPKLPDNYEHFPSRQVLHNLPTQTRQVLTTTPTYPNHRPSYANPYAPIDESNLYGGLQPPSEQSTPPTTTPAAISKPPTYLQPPTHPTPASSVRTYQIYPPIANATTSNELRHPHYSSPYAGVAHSRNATWMHRKAPEPLEPYNPLTDHQAPVDQQVKLDTQYEIEDDIDVLGAKKPTTPATARRGFIPPPHNRNFYPSPSTSLQSAKHVESALDDDTQLPISEALRMLLRPYFNLSGTVDNTDAERAESHIMSLINHPTSTTTPTSVTRTTSNIKNASSIFNPTTTVAQLEDDVELILAGEQHNLMHTVTVPTTPSTGKHEIRTDFHQGQENSNPRETSDWHKRKHSREYHLRHPNIPNPFNEDERSSATPPSTNNRHNHHHSHHTHNNHHLEHNSHQHSREFHLRHPNLPNPFATTPARGDETLVEADDEFIPNPNAESTTQRSGSSTRPNSGRIDLRSSFDTPTNCQYDCGNGKCIANFEVCDGVNNCGNRKDESKCDHLGYNVRLTGGESPNTGRIEVKVLGKWGYVCDDKFGLRDADVVCKELGFKLGASEVRGNSFYAPTEVNFSYLMDEVECRGNETSLKDCDFKGWGVNNCGPDEVVGVVCKVPLLKCPNNYWLCSTSKECIPPAFVCDNTPDCTDKSDESDQVCNSPIEYRLEGGRGPNEGRLEVKYRGEWGTICDDDFGLKEAQVACNSLGYYGRPKIEKNIYGLSNGPIWLDQVSCFGNETAVDKCNHWTWGEHNCNHTEDVAISCAAGPPPRRTTQLHSSGGAGKTQGRNEQAEEDLQTTLEDIGLYSSQVERSSRFLSTLGNNEQFRKRCGHFKDDLTDEYAHPEQRVVNGTVARRGRHPWQATIRTRGRGGISSHWCGAVLISKKHLLTAGHCLAGYPKGAYFVRMGDHYANIAESSEVDSYIENWYVHEKFRDKTHMNNDLALIVLKTPVRFNDYVQPICLPEKGAPLAENRMCTISGWGSIKSGVSTPSNILRAAQLPILADETCKQSHVYGNAMTEGMFCAGSMDESVDACDGDSGGPLVCSDEDGETLYGIISWGQHCGYVNKPGVYVRVEKYIDWIYEKINFSMQQAGK